MAGKKPQIKHKKKPPSDFLHGLQVKIDPGKLDRRTKLGRQAKEMEQALMEYGGHKSPESALLVRSIVQQVLRLEMFYRTMEPEGSLSLPPAYLPLVNSLRLGLQRLNDLAHSDDDEIDPEEWLNNIRGVDE